MNISVVIPFFNEEGNVDFVLREVKEVLDTSGVDFEIIAIDDGSTDATGALLKKACGELTGLRILTRRKNCGQDAAFWAGFQMSTGEVIVMMDGDRQSDAHDIPRMLTYLDKYTAVFGQRKKRQDSPQKLIVSRIAFFFRRLVLNDGCPDTACSLKVIKREALQHLIPIRGFIRFIPFLFKEAGVSSIAIDVNHRRRSWGKTKYCLTKLYFLSTIIDLIFMWWYKKRNILKTIPAEEEKKL